MDLHVAVIARCRHRSVLHSHLHSTAWFMNMQAVAETALWLQSAYLRKVLDELPLMQSAQPKFTDAWRVDDIATTLQPQHGRLSCHVAAFVALVADPACPQIQVGLHRRQEG